MRNDGDAEFAELLDGRALRYLFEVGGRTVHLRCRVRGRVQRVRSLKNAVFSALDTSDELQLVFTRETLSADLFEVAERLRPDMSIEAWVETEFLPERTPPIRLLVTDFRILPSSRIAERRSDPGLEQSSSRIELASVARSIANDLLSQGWVEAAPLTISTSLDQPVEPLQVIFPGLGAETALVVSPVAELAEIAQVTGNYSLFSVSRIYSRAIRDGFTSPESLALVSVRISNGVSADPDYQLLEQLVRKALEPLKGRLSQRERTWLSGTWERRSSRTLGPIHEVSTPTHEVTSLESGLAFRSVWPHPISLVEGHIRILPDSSLQCVTVHCERVLHLVSDVHYRRLQESPRLG
jgi:hypothetical protein